MLFHSYRPVPYHTCFLLLHFIVIIIVIVAHYVRMIESAVPCLQHPWPPRQPQPPSAIQFTSEETSLLGSMMLTPHLLPIYDFQPRHLLQTFTGNLSVVVSNPVGGNAVEGEPESMHNASGHVGGELGGVAVHVPSS